MRAFRSSSQSSAASPQTWPVDCKRPAPASAATRFGSDCSSRRRPPSARDCSWMRCRACTAEPRAIRGQAAPWPPAPRGPRAARCAPCWRRKRRSRRRRVATRSAMLRASSLLGPALSYGPAAQATRGRRRALRCVCVRGVRGGRAERVGAGGREGEGEAAHAKVKKPWRGLGRRTSAGAEAAVVAVVAAVAAVAAPRSGDW